MLSGYYGYGNIGDETLMHTIINKLKSKKPDIRIIVLTHKRDSFLDENNIDSISRLNLLKIRSAMKKTRLYINGGGSLLQDSTSTKSLIYYLLLLKTANKLGLKTYLYANGMGPITKEKNIERVKEVLKSVDYMSIRDNTSYDFIKDLGIEGKNISLTTDEIFGIDISKSDKKLIDDNYMVISLRDWHKKDKSIYEKLTQLIKQVHQEYNLKPVFILSKQNDVKITKIIHDKLDIDSAQIHYGHSLEETIQLISQAKLVISIRLHPLIFGLCSDVPVYGISYDPKIVGVLQSANYPYYYSDMSKFDIESSMKQISQLLEEGISPEIKKEIQKKKDISEENSDIAIKILNGGM